MEVIATDERVTEVLRTIEVQEKALSEELTLCLYAVRQLEQRGPLDPLCELDVALDVVRSHMAQVTAGQTRQRLGFLALGGYWCLIKLVLECLERLRERIISWKGTVPTTNHDKLIELCGPAYQLLLQLPHVLTLLPIFPASDLFIPLAVLEKCHAEEMKEIRKVKRHRLGFEFDKYLTDYCRKLDAVYCAVADALPYAGVRKQISFSSSIIRYSLAPNDAAARADQIRNNLSLEQLRGVWNIVEDPFLRYFAIKFGYFPDEPVLVDKNVTLSLDAENAQSPSHTPPPPHPVHGHAPHPSLSLSHGPPAQSAPDLLSLGSYPPPSSPAVSLTSLAARLMSSHESTQAKSIFTAPPPTSAAAEPSSFLGLGLLRSLSFPSFAFPDISLFRKPPEPPGAHSLHHYGPPISLDSSVILHFHGGGWVSQTAETHIVYLRGWARDLGVPVLSVNYTLSPEAPFPGPLDQCYAAYKSSAGLVSHPQKLGLSGAVPPRVFVAGDSAGGNLAAAVTVRALRENIPPPAGVLLIYPALFLGELASPSRLLLINDPILTYQTSVLCLNSYVPPEMRASAAQHPEISPGAAPTEILQRFPPTQVLVGNIDPIIDDSIVFVQKLRRLGRDVVLKIFNNLPHGFMNVSDQIPACVAALQESGRSLYALMQSAQRDRAAPAAAPSSHGLKPGGMMEKDPIAL